MKRAENSQLPEPEGTKRESGHDNPDRDLWLDENGYRMLAALERAAGPNRSLLAAVHRARAEIAANPALARLPFDKVVSAVARISELPVLAPCGAADATAPEDPGPASLRLEMAPPALPPSGKTRR